MTSRSLFAPLLIITTAAFAQAPPDPADVNRDGVVSQAEAEYNAAVRLQFYELDRNRDGRLDPTELSGLAPAPPGAVPVLPQGAIGRPAGTVTPGSGVAGATAQPGAARAGTRVPAPAMPTPLAGPGLPDGPASGSPFGSPFNSTDTDPAAR